MARGQDGRLVYRLAPNSRGQSFGHTQSPEKRGRGGLWGATQKRFGPGERRPGHCQAAPGFALVRPGAVPLSVRINDGRALPCRSVEEEVQPCGDTRVLTLFPVSLKPTLPGSGFVTRRLKLCKLDLRQILPTGVQEEDQNSGPIKRSSRGPR